MAEIPALYLSFLFWFYSHFKLNFLKPIYFHLVKMIMKYDMWAENKYVSEFYILAIEESRKVYFDNVTNCSIPIFPNKLFRWYCFHLYKKDQCILKVLVKSVGGWNAKVLSCEVKW